MDTSTTHTKNDVIKMKNPLNKVILHKKNHCDVLILSIEKVKVQLLRTTLCRDHVASLTSLSAKYSVYILIFITKDAHAKCLYSAEEMNLKTKKSVSSPCEISITNCIKTKSENQNTRSSIFEALI